MKLNATKKIVRTVIIICLMGSFSVSEVFAGGPWVLGKGQTEIYLGYSRKTASKRWTPTHLNTNGTPYGYDDTWGKDSLVEGTNLIDNKFHDFRYTYFQPSFGLTNRIEVYGNFLFLDGREVSTTDLEGKPLGKDENGNQITEWEVNKGLTDFWLGIKYQVLKGDWPVAVEFNSRFPDFYSKSSDVYSRYDYKYYTDPVTGVKDTTGQPSAAWRGLKKRDFNFLVHAGHSFANYRAWVQAYAGYSIRQDAFADQVLAGISGGYNFFLDKNHDWTLAPQVAFYYDNGLENGAIPDATDRFSFGGRQNYYFNSPTTGRLYGSVIGSYKNMLSVTAGAGYWIFGKGCPQYTEMFVQLGYRVGKKCD